MNDLWEFGMNPWNEMSSLDMSKKYCAKAWHPGAGNIYDFEYTMVDCDSNEENERICMKKPIDCSAQAGRKKGMQKCQV